MNKLVAQTMAKKENGEKGFTLIELLVVVIIIGILAAIAIPVFLNMRQGAWRSSVETDVKNAVLAIETVTTQNNGKVPSALIATANAAGSPYKLDKTGATTTGTAIATLTISPDNTLTITKDPGTNTYTVTGTNTNLGTTGDVNYKYDSATGAGKWQAPTP